ncbi:MAG: hypothetical protein WC314_25680 [Vulcanimicrobiota bacterium]
MAWWGQRSGINQRQDYQAAHLTTRMAVLGIALGVLGLVLGIVGLTVSVIPLLL